MNKFKVYVRNNGRKEVTTFEYDTLEMAKRVAGYYADCAWVETSIGYPAY